MWTPFSPLARLGWKWVLFLPLRLVMKPPPLLSTASLQQLALLLQVRLPAQPLPGPASFVHWGPGAWTDHLPLSARVLPGRHL